MHLLLFCRIHTITVVDAYIKQFQVIKSVYVQVIPEAQALDSPKHPIVLQGCFSYCWDVRHSRSLIQSFRQLHQPADHTFRFSESCLKGAKAAGKIWPFIFKGL